MIRRYKLWLEYDGSAFFGWQIQSKTKERTVQAVLQEALAKLPGEHLSIKAAGRTDAGVHALAMVAHFDSDTPLEPGRLQRAMNAHLPSDIQVIKLMLAPRGFEAQFDCCYRYYVYKMRYVREDLRGLVLDRKRVLALYKPLDALAMQEAAKKFVGRKDFAALASKETRQTTREVYLCELSISGRDMLLHIVANGFLRGMVRAVVGTLLAVGEGKCSPEDIPKILASRDRGLAGKKVSAHGLYFAEAGYEPWSALMPLLKT